MRCLNDSIYNTSEFQELQKLYPNYSRGFLKDALAFWQDEYRKGQDIIPLGKADKGSFTRFLNTRAQTLYRRSNTSDVELDELIDRYNELNNIYDPDTLWETVGDIVNAFTSKVNAYAKLPQNKNKRRSKLIAEMGGFKGVMRQVLADFKKNECNFDFWFTNFRKSSNPEFARMSDEELSEYVNGLVEEANIVVEHFDALVSMAARKIQDKENISVKFDQNSESINEDESQLDDEKPQNNTEDGEGAKGDRYIDFRSLKLEETLSEKTRILLGSISMRNSDLSITYSRFRHPITMDGKQITYKLLEIFSQLDDSSDFVTQLEGYKGVYPWMSGLVQKLRRDPDLRTTIYCDFKRAIYMYDHIRKSDNGTTYEYHYENTSNLQNAFMRNAGNTMRAGVPLDEKFSVYNHDGLKTDVDRSKDGTEDYSPEKVGERLSELAEMARKLILRSNIINPVKSGNAYSMWGTDGSKYATPFEAMRALLSDWEQDGTLAYIVGAFRGIGADITVEQLKAAAMEEMSRTTGELISRTTKIAGIVNFGRVLYGGNRLAVALYGLSAIYKRAGKQVKAGELGIDSFYANGEVSSNFMGINMVIAPGLAGNVEPSTLVGKKRLQTYNKPNLLHDVFDVFRQGGTLDRWIRQAEEERLAHQYDREGYTVRDRVVEYFQKEYIDCEGFTVRAGKKVDGSPEYRLTGVLADILYKGQRLKVTDATTFNGVDYADMSPSQKVTSAVVRYRKEGLVEVPIMADYGSAYNFISMPHRSVGNVELEGESTKNNAKIQAAPKVVLDPNSELVESVIDEVLCEIEVIAAARERLAAAKEGKWNSLGGYDERASKFQLFKEFNDNGFLEDYLALDPENKPSEAREFVRGQVVDQLTKIVEDDLAYFAELGIYNNSLLNKTFHTTVGHSRKAGLLVDTNTMKAMVDFSLNALYGRQQITKILNGGMAQFESTIDFEKRAMMNHAPRSPFYKDASWESEGKPVVKPTQKVIYLGDSVDESKYIDEERAAFEWLRDNKRITPEQCEYFVGSFTGIKETDGQGLRAFDSWRNIMIGTNHWSPALESAYKAVKDGTFSTKDIQVLIEGMEYFRNFKPVYTGYEFIDGYNKGKKIKLSVTHKYAETVLLPTSIMNTTIKGSSTPVRGIAKAVEELGVDMALFKSGVKVNSHSEIKVFGKKDGAREYKTSDDIAKAIVDQVRANPHSIHELDLKYYGEAASTPVHVMDARISWAAQAELMAFCDADDSIQDVIVGGKAVSSAEAKRLYTRIKFTETLAAWRELQKKLSDPNKLEEMLQEELADKNYNSPEMKFALRQIKKKTFALPLFSPSIEHEVTELMTSIIKKALLKHKTRGTNIFQSSSFGLDDTPVRFQDENIDDDTRLKIEWENKGVPGKERVKYIECYLPITDSWLLKFADKKGEISPKALQMLVDSGQIPESLLYAVGYRTPSDGMHSLFPLKIKGFTSNIEGANILLPKEAMTLAGLDFDGDKLRVHLKSFHTEWDEGGIRNEYEKFLVRLDENRLTKEDYRIIRLGQIDDSVAGSDDEIMRVILDQEDLGTVANVSYEEFYKGYTHKRNKTVRYLNLVEDAYDFNVDPEYQSSSARDNGRIDLIFANLTSPSGTAKMLIPGGAVESAEMAKRVYIIRQMSDQNVLQILINAGIATAADTPQTLYKKLKNKDNRALDGILSQIEGYTTPFSVKHSAEAHERIVGGKQLVSVFAKENAITQLFKDINLHYVPHTFKKGKNAGKELKMKLFGHDIDRLYGLYLDNGNLQSRALSRLLNAAVDNAKEPILGLVNICKEMVPVVNFFLAAGINEEELDVFMTQPVFIEIARRLKTKQHAGIADAVSAMIVELTGKKEAIDNYEVIRNASKFNSVSFDQCVDCLPVKYADLVTEDRDNKVLGTQLRLLYGILHMAPAISELQELTGLVRPDSTSGALGTSIADITIMKDKFNKYAEKKIFHLSGAEPHKLLPMMIDVSQNDASIYGKTSWLPQVQLLNSLFYNESLQFFEPYFPHATSSWQTAALDVLSRYTRVSSKDGVMQHIFQEMILWKLMGIPALVGSNAEEVEKIRRYYVIDFPKHFADKKAAIKKATKEDVNLYPLKKNMFLNKLTVYQVKFASQRPRIQFRSGGPSLSGFGEVIRQEWASLLQNPDPEIRKMALDLFMYNMFTNGFGFGMYEFSHLAPFSVLAEVPHYLDSLHSLTSGISGEFSDPESEDFQNFLEWYYSNHWDDANLVPHFKPDQIPVIYRGQFGIGEVERNSVDSDWFSSLPFFTLVTKVPTDKGGYRTVKKFYKREQYGSSYKWFEAPKAGFKGLSDQAFLCYNPYMSMMAMTPINAGDDSVWGKADEYGRIGGNRTYRKDSSTIAQAEAGRLTPIGSVPVMATHVAEAARDAAKENHEVLEENASVKSEPEQKEIITGTEELAAAENGTAEAEPVSAPFGLPEDLQKMVNSLGADGVSFGYTTNKKMLQIARTTVNSDGSTSVVLDKYPVNPRTLREARRQEAFIRLHDKLVEILREKGVAVGVLEDFEKRLSISGVADFDTAKVTAEGLVEMIRIAEGVGGLEALPEEFAHLAIEMLGHDHPLVERLISSVDDEEVLKEVFGDFYDAYNEKYSKEFDQTDEGRKAFRDKMVLEAAGKLLAKELLYQEMYSNRPFARLVKRVSDAAKKFLRLFNKRKIQDAIFDSENVASQLARNILSGRLLDQMDRDKVGTSGKYLQVVQDLSDKTDIMSKLLKNATKRKVVLEKRLRFTTGNTRDAVMNATHQEIKRLEDSIEKNTVQQGVYQHLLDTMNYLSTIEQAYNISVAGGYDVGVISRYLRVFNDALGSAAQALEDINKAIQTGELPYTEEIKQVLGQYTSVLNEFGNKYQTEAMEIFKSLLVNIYGVQGKTITVGKDKGKVISIDEMARRASHDISLMSRMFHSLADNNDLVLKAFDDATRTAKKNSRKRANVARAKIEEAFERLRREEGSRDQSFMFKYEVKNGKTVKTGEYITEEESRRLSSAKKHFYDVIMEIKHEIDSYLPESEVGPLKIVMITKSRMERVLQSEGVKSGAEELWEGVQNSILDMSEDIDFENKEVLADFGGNEIDLLPIHYVHKAPHLSYDDMSDDVASTMLAYAGMGYEYNELSGIIDWLEVSRDMAARREIEQHTGNKRQIETVNDEEGGYAYSQPYSAVQMKSHMQQALDDFFHMHLYGYLQRDEGTIGNSRIDKRKAANKLNHFASLSQMAVNLQQRLSNVSTGLSMIIIESAGKGTFNARDVLWANGQYLKYTPDRILGFGSTNHDNKLSLWIDYHDITNDNGRENKNRKYGKSWGKRVFGEQLLYTGLMAGEDYLASVTSLALARNFKVLNQNTGKQETLWDAYEVAYIDDVNKTGAYLRLKDGYTKLDGSPITEEDERRFSKKVAGVNFELQGIYDLDDKSPVQQWALGSLIIMYRKWIAPALKRRYGSADYNILKEQDVEGYYRTTGRYLLDVFKDIRHEGNGIMTAVKTNWYRMNDYERGNCRKAITEMGIILGCVVSIAALSKWEPDRDEDAPKLVSWLDHQFLYQLMRLRNEVGSQAPTPLLVNEATKLLKSPMAATRPLAAGLDAFQLLLPHNYFTEVRSGRYKGHTKAYKYFFDLPIISMGRNIQNFRDPSNLIKFYNSNSF